MNREEFRRRVETIDRLPIAHKVATTLFRGLGERGQPPGALVTLVSSDVALAAHVMRVAGGVPGRSGTPASAISDAVQRIGYDSCESIARMAVAGPHAPNTDLIAREIEALAAHSVACAVWAECIADLTQSDFRGLAYTAGLLHDLGKLALLSVAPETAGTAGAVADPLAPSHTLAGKWLSERWGLPEYVTDVAWLHHHSLATISALRQAHTDLIALVSLANILAKDASDFVPNDLLRHFRLGPSELESLRAQALPRIEQWNASLREAPEEIPAADALRARTDTLEKLVALERQNRQLRALNELHMKLRPGLPLEDVLTSVADSVRTALQVAPGLCYIADSQEQWVHGKSWRALDDTPRDLVLSLRGATPAERVDLDAQLLCAIQSLAVGSKNAPSAAHADLPWRRGGFAALPILDLGAKTAHVIFDSAGSRRVFCPDDAQDLVAFVQSCGVALRRYLVENRVAAQAEDFAELLEGENRGASDIPAPNAAEAIQAFVAGAAHHINNPLTVISGRAQQLIGKMATPAEMKALDDIVAHSHRITRILSDLMTFSSAPEPRLEPALINVIIQQSLAGVRQRLNAKKIQIVERYAEGLPRVRVDRRQISAVVMNLVSNAEWSMNATGGVLTIETRQQADQRSIRIRISDTGRGVAPGEAAHIFTPFFSKREGGEALGLGLATCRGILHAHHGAIRLAPGTEQGATFEITLPVTAEALVFPALRTPENETVAQAAAPPARQRTILIANDDDDLREILTETLKKRGYLVHAVSNGAQALETVRTRSVDLVLIDTRMPERDGLSVLTELRNQYASLPVILITNRASQEETEEAIRLGARSCLSKPFEIKRLLSEVERFVVNG